MLNILIADDHAIVRKGLTELLLEKFPDAKISEVNSGQEVLKVAARASLDIILMDIAMPGRNGIEILKQLRASGIKSPILILSMYPEDQYAIRALKAGASGFLNKDKTNEELLAAVDRLLMGKKYVSNSVAERMVDLRQAGEAPLHDRLSDREMEVLRMLANGKTVTEVANEIALSVNTVSTYRTRILEKLGLQNNAEITRYAIDQGLI